MANENELYIPGGELDRPRNINEVGRYLFKGLSKHVSLRTLQAELEQIRKDFFPETNLYGHAFELEFGPQGEGRAYDRVTVQVPLLWMAIVADCRDDVIDWLWDRTPGEWMEREPGGNQEGRSRIKGSTIYRLRNDRHVRNETRRVLGLHGATLEQRVRARIVEARIGVRSRLQRTWWRALYGGTQAGRDLGNTIAEKVSWMVPGMIKRKWQESRERKASQTHPWPSREQHEARPSADHPILRNPTPQSDRAYERLFGTGGELSEEMQGMLSNSPQAIGNLNFRLRNSPRNILEILLTYANDPDMRDAARKNTARQAVVDYVNNNPAILGMPLAGPGGPTLIAVAIRLLDVAFFSAIEHSITPEHLERVCDEEDQERETPVPAHEYLTRIGNSSQGEGGKLYIIGEIIRTTRDHTPRDHQDHQNEE